MRKLTEYVKEQKKDTDKAAKKNLKPAKRGLTYYMPITADRQQAIDDKLKRLQGNIFGKPINKLDVGTVRDVWVPYGYFIYDYEVGGDKGLFKRKREGQVYVIYDMNERHCIQYDEKESGPLPLERKDFSNEKWPSLKVGIGSKQIFADVEEYIQMKIMYKTFGRRGKLKLVKHVDFFRPAVELEIFFKGENRNIRFAYLDDYAVKNEHILGMKYRITH